MALLGDVFGGASRGLTAVLWGAPVDLITMGLNAGIAGANQLGANVPAIQNPVLGSEWIAQRMRDAGVLNDNPGSLGDMAGGLLPLAMMPIKPTDMAKIRGLLGAIERGQTTKKLTLSEPLTAQQFSDLQKARQGLGMPTPKENNFVFRGTHMYDSRAKDGYTVDDMIRQLESGTSEKSVVIVDKNGRVGLQNPIPRNDGYGNAVNDTVTFELSGKPEMLSAIPKGDLKKKKPR